jgi:hypothetical protein
MAREYPPLTAGSRAIGHATGTANLRITSVRRTAPHRSTPELTLDSLCAGVGGCWLLTAVRGHLGGTLDGG